MGTQRYVTGAGVLCSQCDSDLDPYCREMPPPPENCTLCTLYSHLDECLRYQEVNYCITERRYINDTLVRITRDCSPSSLPETCETITKLDVQIKVCFNTCKYSGCNSSGNVRFKQIIVMLLVTMSTFLK
ncbi:hypothetical protein MAR_029091 [Mya arenaria]|uniref:Protein quiver n=1 Tax=Mya arenaria TaxID=6604 RepID=A0ABY7DHE1_MYAAR|nr:hypothetical protein MAR_029091 [Mya arenaria]